MKRHSSNSWMGSTLMMLLTAMLVGCGPAMVGDVGDDGSALKGGGEVELPEGADQTFIEGLVFNKNDKATQNAPSCLYSDVDGWCNPDGESGCRSGRLFKCAMGQRCASQKYVDRQGTFAGCTWENSAQASKVPATHCTEQVGGYCKSQRVGVGCRNKRQVTFYCAGASNTCETRTCGRMTLTGCSQNHPCNGVRGTFAACSAGQRKTCWWNGYKGEQRCEGGNWSWMCYTQAESPGASSQCHAGQTRTCHWNGHQGHQTCEGGKWSYLCHTNGSPQNNPNPWNQECWAGQTRGCQWNGYPGHQTCQNGQWSHLCYTNNNDGHGNYGAECHPGQTRVCWWNGHEGHQTCEGNTWSWLCHTTPQPNPHDPHQPGWNDPHQPQNGGCHPGQTRGCNWKGHPGIQKCQGGSWSYLCYTFD